MEPDVDSSEDDDGDIGELGRILNPDAILMAQRSDSAEADDGDGATDVETGD